MREPDLIAILIGSVAPFLNSLLLILLIAMSWGRYKAVLGRLSWLETQLEAQLGKEPPPSTSKPKGREDSHANDAGPGEGGG